MGCWTTTFSSANLVRMNASPDPSADAARESYQLAGQVIERLVRASTSINSAIELLRDAGLLLSASEHDNGEELAHIIGALAIARTALNDEWHSWVDVAQSVSRQFP